MENQDVVLLTSRGRTEKVTYIGPDTQGEHAVEMDNGCLEHHPMSHLRPLVEFKMGGYVNGPDPHAVGYTLVDTDGAGLISVSTDVLVPTAKEPVTGPLRAEEIVRVKDGFYNPFTLTEFWYVGKSVYVDGTVMVAKKPPTEKYRGLSAFRADAIERVQ